MPAQTSMLHIRVDDHLKAQAADALAGVGLTPVSYTHLTLPTSDLV